MSIIPTVLAHEVGDVVDVIGPTLAETVRQNQINFTLATAAILFVLTILSILMSKVSRRAPQVPVSVPEATQPQQSVAATVTPPIPAESLEAGPAQETEGAWWKTVIFTGMVLAILVNSAYLVGSTLYVNAKSVTNGPVHWHADFEVWYCERKLELVDPAPPSNRVGTRLLHEHGDDRIHIEEAVFDMRDISLATFFKIVGGDLHAASLEFPTNEGVKNMRNGDLCPDDTPGTLQVFLYRAGSFTQQKLADPENYLITQEQNVPPGDCLIFEFGSPKENTEHLCQSYEVDEEKQSAH